MGEQYEENMMKLLQYSIVVKAIAMSVALAFSSATFAAETKNGKTYLVLKHADVNHVIMFSDRPNRIVKIITGSSR